MAEKITAWITQWALTSGITEVVGEVWKDKYLRYGEYGFASGKDWHRTKEAAINRAEEMRLRKIASVKKQLEKLEKMRFE